MKDSTPKQEHFGNKGNIFFRLGLTIQKYLEFLKPLVT